MSSSALFEVEAQALADTRELLKRNDVGADDYRRALTELATHYERLIRETYRLIRRSDREEREMYELNQRLNDLASQLNFRATHDPLTGILNRAAVIEAVAHHLSVGDLALIILDIDHFKTINDVYGHPVGDQVIVKLTQCLSAILGPRIEIGRIGGEEFTILLPHHTLRDAMGVAERIRTNVAETEMSDQIAHPVTVSIGVSWNAQGCDFSNAYRRTDEAMYQAKRGGRNQVVAVED